MSLYAMSKAAVWGLTKGAARDLGLRVIAGYNTPDEIAQMTLYLASDAARSVTSSSFLLDGGANL